MIVDSYDVVFGQLDPEEMRRVNRSRNYAQALVSDPRDVYSAFDEVEQEFGARKVKYAAQGYDPFSTFNPDAPSGVDPFTGATARDYAELLYPVVDGVLRTGAAAGANTLGAAYQAAGHMLSTFVDMGEYLSKDLGVPRSELFDKMAKATVARGDQFRKYAQEEGIGPVTNWLTEVLGQAPAGIADFILNVPFYGTKGAMKAEKAGDNEFVGFLKGALERGLMGQVLHAAATLSRPLRMGVTGAVFEEQARHEGITDPEELLKAFATGSLFGVVGGKGKYGPHEIRKELANLEMEAREWIEGLDPRAVIGERGSNKGSYIGDPITPWLDRYEKIAKGEGTARDVTTLRNQTVAVIDRSIQYFTKLGEELGDIEYVEGKKGEGESSYRKATSPEGGELADLLDMLHDYRDAISGSKDRAETVVNIDKFVNATHGNGELLLRGMYGNNDGIAEAGVKLQETLDRLAGKSPVEGKKVLERGMAGDDISADLLKSGIPGFKNTEEAVSFGKKATPEQVAKLKEALEKGYADVASRKDAAFEAMKKGDFTLINQLQKDAQQNALMREAIETAGGAPRYGGGSTRGELESQGYIPVYRGAGKRGFEGLKSTEGGVLGDGVYFYTEPSPARSHATTGGGVITGFIKPEDATISGNVVVVKDPSKVIVRGKIPVEETVISGKAWVERTNKALEEVAPRYGGGGTAVEKATLAEFESSPPPGYRIKTLPGEDIARAESDGTISLDPNKFFGHGEKDRVDIIAHEKAHFLEEKIPPDVKARLFDDPVVMGYRGRNINEKLANMIQDGKLPQELKGYVEGSGGAGEGGQPPKGGEGAPPSGGGPPPEKPKQYTKVLFTKKGSDRKIDPHGKELLNDIVDIEVGIEAETGKPAVNKKYLWEMTKEEAGDILKRGGLDPSLHKLAIDKALLQGKNVPLEAMRGYFPEGDLLVMEGIDGIFGLKEYEMQKWLDMKTDAALLYEHTKKMLTEKDRRDIKARVREVTGQIPASDIIEMREDQLLRNQLKMEALAARGVFRTGLKEGQLLHAKRFQEIIEMARERGDARREINYMIRELRTVDPDKMTAHCSDEVHRLLDHLDLKKLSTNKRISLEKTLDFLSRNPETELPEYVFDDLARLNKIPIRDLSYYEIQSIHKAVMSLAAQSERVQYLNVKMRQVKIDEAIKTSISEMKNPAKVNVDVISTRPSMVDKFKGLSHWIRVNLGLRQDSYDLIVESLAGTDSVMYDVLYRGPKRGIVKQKEAQQKAERNFRDSLKADGFFDSVKNPDKWMDERVRVGRFELSRGERMALYMHSLNADNAKAILEGGIGFKNPPPSSGLTPNSVVRLTESDLAEITRSLTKEELMMVKAAQAMFRDQGVDLANEFYRLNKYRMPPQDNYYPKDVMPLRRGGLDLETEEGLEAFRQFTARVGIDKSMLIERQGSVAPIYLNDLMTDINRSVRRASAYLGLEDPMMNASRMLYDSTFKRNIIDRYGRDTWVELEKGLKDIAGSYRSWTSLEKGLTLLKTRAVSSALSINPWIWLNQPFSLATYWAYIEPRYLAKGLIDSITHPKDTLDGLRMYSAELIDRLKTGYDRDVAAVYAAERDKAFYKGKSTLTEKGITPTKYFDLTAVVPGMKAAVYKALEEFQTGELSRPVRQALNVTPEEVMGWTPEQKVAKAHEFADWVAQRTQAQSTPEHRSPLSRGTPLEQMFTAFTSQTNVMLGLVRRTYRDYQRTRDPEALRTMLKAWTSVFVLNAAAMIGVDRLRDLVYGRDSKSTVSGFIDNTASLMYFVRDIVRTMTSFIEEGHRGKESTVPLARFAETLKDLAIHFHDSFSDNHFTAEKAQLGVIDSLLQLGSIYTGLPYQTPKRLLQAATGNNPPPKHRKGEDKSFIDELLED